MILLSHPTGNENVRQAAIAFREAGLLREFWTCISWDPETSVNQFLPHSLRQQLSRRSFHPGLRAVTRTAPAREMGRLLVSALGVSMFSEHETGPLSVDAVYADLDRKVAARLARLPDCSLVYAYEDGALETFRAAQSQNISRVYDLPIGYWRVAQQIYAEEREREPAWAVTMTGARDSEEKLARKDEELKLANRVVVASSFTKETLGAADFAVDVQVIPYGAPPSIPSNVEALSGPLRILFVGSLGQRKGLSYLLQAIELLGSKVALTLLGRKAADGCQPLEEAVRKHRWIPSLPHPELLHVMQQHDVLVLPSLFEGFGLVILEAMAQGLPVITTAHTAGPDVISQGVDGFIVPIRSAEAIAARLDQLASTPNFLREMKHAAQDKAKLQRWENYRDSLIRMARDLVFKNSPAHHATRA
jgi:glycosyltransferase involved in cell wall biosynthesis